MIVLESNKLLLDFRIRIIIEVNIVSYHLIEKILYIEIQLNSK